MYSRLTLFLALFFTGVFTRLTLAFHNVTIDDDDPLITYHGNWSRTLPGFGMAAGGTYMTSKNDPAAYATVNFTGVAVYFMCARWPYQITTQLTIDDGPPTVLNLEDYSKHSTGENFGRAFVVASATGLESRPHTIRISAVPGEPFAVLDAFLYTALDPDDLYPSPTSPPTAFTSAPVSLATYTRSEGIPSATPGSMHPPTSSPARSSGAAHGLTRQRLAIILICISCVVALTLLVAIWHFRYRTPRLLPPPSPEMAEKRVSSSTC